MKKENYQHPSLCLLLFGQDVIRVSEDVNTEQIGKPTDPGMLDPFYGSDFNTAGFNW